nr:hypothetical protein KitaXyl93_69490 [Kitasatospora sp. Xyl93]
MPVRLLAALLLGLLSLLPSGCAQPDHDAHPTGPSAATALSSTRTTGPSEPSGLPERDCPQGDSAAPALRSPRPTAAPVPSSAPAFLVGPGGGRVAPRAVRTATAAAVRRARTPGPRGPLLATGRWRI